MLCKRNASKCIMTIHVHEDLLIKIRLWAKITEDTTIKGQTMCGIVISISVGFGLRDIITGRHL